MPFFLTFPSLASSGRTRYRLLSDEAERVRWIDPDAAAMMLAEACLGRFLSADLVSASRARATAAT